VNTIRAYLSAGYWRHGFSFKRVATAYLAALGVLWLLTEILVFYGLFPSAVAWLRENWWLFPTCGMLWAVWENRPRHAIGCSLKNRDVRVEIRIGDLFAGSSSVVVPCNTSFDTDVAGGLISKNSVQGQFTQRLYTDVAHLDTDLAKALAEPFAPTGVRSQKRGKPLVYPMGTTVTLRPQGRTAYFCAVAGMNAQGNASATFDDIQTALPKLWDHISSAGDHGDVVVPILGSGFARVAASREVLIHEIVRSFIAACASQRPCTSLSVVIRAKDYYEHGLDLAELGNFLAHLCRYTDFAPVGARGGGQPMPVSLGASVGATQP
jgi:Domain of unknown function (DUF6430)